MTFSVDSIQAALESHFEDDRWLRVLEVFVFTGVADAVQLQEATGLSRGQLRRMMERFETLLDAGLIDEVPFSVPRPGRRGRPSTVYQLGKIGAAILRKRGHPDAHPCGLNTERRLAHARSVLDIRLAATKAGLGVRTEKEIGYVDDDQERALRPDNLVTLPDGTQALFEVEQKASLSLLRRIVEGVRNKVAFFNSAEAAQVSSVVRVSINVPRGREWDRTVAVWERATAIVAEEASGDLPFEIVAIPHEEFLDDPDWSKPPVEERWESLFDPAQTTAFSAIQPVQQDGERQTTPAKQPKLPTGLKRRAARDDYLIMRAYWQHVLERGPGLMYAHDRPAADPVFFDVMSVIYAASHPPDATPWEAALHPHTSLYLLQRYLRMHPRLLKALSKAIVRGGGSMRWSTPTITHRIQAVTDVFLRYHGFRSGGSLRVSVIGPWGRDDDRGDFDIRVRLEPEVLMGEGDSVVPTPEEVKVTEDALRWVLISLFVYPQDLGVKRSYFW